MKALSLWQPWATLMALGFKSVETRGWATNYRGPLAIAATKAIPAGDRGDCEMAFDNFVDDYPAFDAAMTAKGIQRLKDLPSGCVLCESRLVDCEHAMILEPGISEMEKDMGYYALGRFGWVTQLVEAFDEPIPCKGAQGLWEWKQPNPNVNLEALI